jgi:hypothetical protein
VLESGAEVGTAVGVAVGTIIVAGKMMAAQMYVYIFIIVNNDSLLLANPFR